MPPPFEAVSLRSPGMYFPLPEAMSPAARDHAPHSPEPYFPAARGYVPRCQGYVPPLPRLCPSLSGAVPPPAVRGCAPRCPGLCPPLSGAVPPAARSCAPRCPELCPPLPGAVPSAARSCALRCPELCPPQWRYIFGSWVSGRQKVPCAQTVGGQWDRTKPRKICHEGVRFTCYTENRWRSAKTGAATDG